MADHKINGDVTGVGIEYGLGSSGKASDLLACAIFESRSEHRPF
jgi:hypothetical protein